MSEEYDDLAGFFDPLYAKAARYLSLKELALQPPRDELTRREVEAILFVAGERQRVRRRERKGRDREGGVTDDALAAQAAKVKRR